MFHLLYMLLKFEYLGLVVGLPWKNLLLNCIVFRLETTFHQTKCKTEKDRLAFLESLPCHQHYHFRSEHNLIEAASNGASASIKIVGAIAVNVLAFLSLLAFLNATLTWFGDRVGIEGLTFEVSWRYIMCFVYFVLKYPTLAFPKYTAEFTKKGIDRKEQPIVAKAQKEWRQIKYMYWQNKRLIYNKG